MSQPGKAIIAKVSNTFDGWEKYLLDFSFDAR